MTQQQWRLIARGSVDERNLLAARVQIIYRQANSLTSAFHSAVAGKPRIHLSTSRSLE